MSDSGHKKKGKWIKKAAGHKGALHEHLHVPEGKKIPEEKLEAAEHSKNPTIRKEANLAKTLKGMHKKHLAPLTGKQGIKSFYKE